MATTISQDIGNLIAGLGGNFANTLGTGADFLYNKSIQNQLLNAGITALNNFAATEEAQKNPDLLAEINSNINLAQQGKITPAQMLSAVQQKSQMYGVQVPKNFTDATNNALAQEAQVATQGYTPVERATIQNALQQVISQQRGEQAAIASQQQARGQYGGGQALDLQQEALQGAITNASNIANQTEANAYNRALAALQAEGQLGLSAGAQSFAQNAAVAQAQDAINSLNTQLQQQANAANQQANQQAILQQSAQQQQRDLANQQAQLNLNQQKVGAVNQTVQNAQEFQNLAGGALKQASATAGAALPAALQSTRQNVAGASQQILGPGSPVSGAIGSLIGKGVGAAGSAIGNWLSGGSGNNPSEGVGFITGGGPGGTDYSPYVSLPTDMSTGGNIDWLGGSAFAEGGEVHESHKNHDDLYAYGGDVEGPGTETSDSIPVLLSNHEYVIKAESAKKHKPLLEAINNDDEESIIEHVLNHIGMPDEEHEMVVIQPKGKDGQKAMADALKALRKIH